MGGPKRSGKPKPLWTGMKPEFESKLHPELAKRIKLVMQDLFDRGWEPFIPELYGREGTGYRSVAEQAEILKKTPGRTSVKFSFHNVTDKEGNPRSMAVHVTDRNMPKHFTKTHPFVLDLEALCQRHGLMTGNQWKKPWDPLHVQLHENQYKKLAKRKGNLPYIKSKLVLLTPHLKLNPAPGYLPPRSLDNILAGERFILQNNYPNNNLYRRFNGLRTMPFINDNPFSNLNLSGDSARLNFP